MKKPKTLCKFRPINKNTEEIFTKKNYSSVMLMILTILLNSE